MFCRNCGKELVGNPEICPDCGARPMGGNSFCHGCGAATTPLTVVCPKCGARVTWTWMPTTARILDLIAGAFAVLTGIIFAATGGFGGLFGFGGLGSFFGLTAGLPSSLLIVLGTAAIVSGIYALKRRTWGLALAASICAFFCVWWLGIPAIVFTVMAKAEFR